MLRNILVSLGAGLGYFCLGWEGHLSQKEQHVQREGEDVARSRNSNGSVGPEQEDRMGMGSVCRLRSWGYALGGRWAVRGEIPALGALGANPDLAE